LNSFANVKNDRDESRMASGRPGLFQVRAGPADPGVDDLKRLRLTPKLFDWLVDGSQFLADRTNGRTIGTVLRLSSVVVCRDVVYCG